MTLSDEVLLSLAREVAAVLTEHGFDPLLIGGAALAAHGYPRFTEDTDFAVAVPPSELKLLASKLPGRAEFSESDGVDPLGGVVTTTREDGKVQIVNFLNPPSGGFPRLVEDARARSTSNMIGAKLVSLEDLILFKAYAGGRKSRHDVAELLTRASPNINLLKNLAAQYNVVRELDFVLDGLA